MCYWKWNHSAVTRVKSRKILCDRCTANGLPSFKMCEKQRLLLGHCSSKQKGTNKIHTYGRRLICVVKIREVEGFLSKLFYWSHEEPIDPGSIKKVEKTQVDYPIDAALVPLPDLHDPSIRKPVRRLHRLRHPTEVYPSSNRRSSGAYGTSLALSLDDRPLSLVVIRRAPTSRPTAIIASRKQGR